MAYKITIPKTGPKAGEVTIETLDSTSCTVVEEITQNCVIKSRSPITHGDDQPIYDSVNVTQ
jgi:hypothetical protein